MISVIVYFKSPHTLRSSTTTSPPHSQVVHYHLTPHAMQNHPVGAAPRGWIYSREPQQLPPCCCGTDCGMYCLAPRPRLTPTGEHKDLAPDCKKVVRKDLSTRLSDMLGIQQDVCAWFFMMTGLLVRLTDPKGTAKTAARMAHVDPKKGITWNMLPYGEKFNGLTTCQLSEEYIGDKNIHDMLAPNNIASTVHDFAQWFDAQHADIKYLFTPRLFSSTDCIPSRITDINERISIVNAAIFTSKMHIEGALVSNTGDVTISVPLRPPSVRVNGVAQFSGIGSNIDDPMEEDS